MKRTILIVDDDFVVVRSLTMQLEDDYNIVSFVSKGCGEDVIKWLNEGHTLDYAILDILINGISGIDIANEILKNYGDKVYISFVTGCSKKSVDYGLAQDMATKYSQIKFFVKPADEHGIMFSEKIENDLLDKLPI